MEKLTFIPSGYSYSDSGADWDYYVREDHLGNLLDVVAVLPEEE